MMWPLFRAIGRDDHSGDYARDTTSHPADDRANDGARVRDVVVAANCNTGTANPEAYGDAATSRLLPTCCPYRVGTPAAFGFTGFNGRALADNAPGVMYSLITNTGFPTGLSSASATETRSNHFPYVVPVGGYRRGLSVPTSTRQAVWPSPPVGPHRGTAALDRPSHPFRAPSGPTRAGSHR
jgi:hypothetical protein